MRTSPHCLKEWNLNYKTILVTDNHPIRTVTLNRPERRNAMTQEMQTELISVIEETAASAMLRVDPYRGGRCFLFRA